MVLITFSNFPDWIRSGQGYPAKPVGWRNFTSCEQKKISRPIFWSLVTFARCRVAKCCNFLPLCKLLWTIKGGAGSDWWSIVRRQRNKPNCLHSAKPLLFTNFLLPVWNKFCKNIKRVHSWLLAQGLLFLVKKKQNRGVGYTSIYFLWE